MQKTMAAICMLILVLTLSACSASSAETISGVSSGESENTTNLIADGADYVYENPDSDEPNAAIFSAADLTIFGGGTLTVQGNNNDGIASKDGLIIASGTITVRAVDDGIRGKDYLVVEDGVITVDAQGDGLKSDNTEDAAKGFISIEAGVLNITAGLHATHAEAGLPTKTWEVLETSQVFYPGRCGQLSHHPSASKPGSPGVAPSPGVVRPVQCTCCLHEPVNGWRTD